MERATRLAAWYLPLRIPGSQYSRGALQQAGLDIAAGQCVTCALCRLCALCAVARGAGTASGDADSRSSTDHSHVQHSHEVSSIVALLTALRTPGGAVHP